MNEIGLKCLDYFSKVKLPGWLGALEQFKINGDLDG